MDDFEKLLQEQLEDSEFKKEWDALELEYEIKKMVIQARAEANLTQKELAELTGIRQSNISRIENGNCIPSLTTLDTIAKGLGKKLKVEFV